MLFNFKHYPIIAAELGTLKPGLAHVPFFTEGRWSLHETLLYLLSVSGAAKVSLTSFSLSEITIVAFANAMRENYITEFDLYLHSAVKRNKLSLLFFAGNVATSVRLLDLHEKLILIENEHWKIAVNQSANSTLNTAWEAGVVSTCPIIFEKYKQHIEKLKLKSTDFTNELKPRTDTKS